MSKILLVDDDKLMRGAMAKALSDHGYEVAQANDGEEAFGLAQANLPDLLVTDIVMPKLDGVGLLEKLHSTDWGKNIPAIVLTIKDTDINDVNKSLKTGVVAYLSKADISRDQVIDLVDQTLHT